MRTYGLAFTVFATLAFACGGDDVSVSPPATDGGAGDATGQSDSANGSDASSSGGGDTGSSSGSGSGGDAAGGATFYCAMGVTCTVGSQICCIDMNGGTCVSSSNCPHGGETQVECAKTADCPMGDVCCGNYDTHAMMYTDVACMTGMDCGGGTQFCDPAANDCPHGAPCRTSQALPGFHTCQ